MPPHFTFTQHVYWRSTESVVPCHVLYCDKQDRHNLFFPEFAASSSLKNWVWKGVDIGYFFLVYSISHCLPFISFSSHCEIKDFNSWSQDYSRKRGIRREGSRRDFPRSLNFHWALGRSFLQQVTQALPLRGWPWLHDDLPACALSLSKHSWLLVTVGMCTVLWVFPTFSSLVQSHISSQTSGHTRLDLQCESQRRSK